MQTKDDIIEKVYTDPSGFGSIKNTFLLDKYIPLKSDTFPFKHIRTYVLCIYMYSINTIYKINNLYIWYIPYSK